MVERGQRVTRAVVFDIGDTLVERPAVGPGHRLATALGLPRETARTITRLLFSEPFADPAELARRLQRELDLARAPLAEVEELWRAQEREPREVPGATACVAAARRAGARIAVVSNIWAPYETGFRRACPSLVPLIDSWHLSYRGGAVKPDPALFRAALAALAVPPRCAIMVGDSLDKDVIPAVGLGMHAVWVQRADEAQGPPARCEVVRSLTDAQDAILRVLRAEPEA